MAPRSPLAGPVHILDLDEGVVFQALHCGPVLT